MNKLTKGGLSILAIGTITAGAGAIWDLKNKLIADNDDDEFEEDSEDEDK